MMNPTGKSDKRILIWGFEDCTGHCMSAVFEGLEAKGYTCAGFVSTDRSHCGRLIIPDGIFLVYHTSKLGNARFDDIVVTSSWKNYQEVRKQLINEYSIPSDTIHFFTWLVTEPSKDPEPLCIKRKVFDCFPFLNEFDVLKLRLELLDPVVDYFVVSELELTHQWTEKPLYFKENQSLFEKYAHKIVYICPPQKDYPAKYEATTDHPLKWGDGLDWSLENYQRNNILPGLTGRASSEDLILVSDVDEIPDPVAVKNLLTNPEQLDRTGVTFDQIHYCYSFNWRRQKNWTGTYAVLYRNIRTPQKWRDLIYTHLLPTIPDGGWHISYFGGAGQVKYKINSMVDGENHFGVGQNMTLDVISDRIKNGEEVFLRETDRNLILLDESPSGMPDTDRIRRDYPQFFA